MVKVLIADDDRDLLDVARSVLWRLYGIKVDQSTCAEEALRKARTGGYDAVVAEHDLPDRSGLQLLEMLKESGSSVPFIMLVPKDGDGLVSQALEGGASFCLRKGGDPALLMADLGDMIKVAVQVRQAAESIAKGGESFWGIVSQSPDMIMVVDANATACYINPAGAALMGADEAELVGSSATELFHPDDARQLGDAIARSRSRPGALVPLRLRARCHGRGCLLLEGEALSTDGRRAMLFLAEEGGEGVRASNRYDDEALRGSMDIERKERRQQELTREITFRLISRMLVDRMSDNENSVSQNRFRGMGGLAAAHGSAPGGEDEMMLMRSSQDDDVMSQLIDRLAERIDLMEIDGDARRVQEANRRFYGPD